MLGHGFYPKMTLPNWLKCTSGATLIDKIQCKSSSQTLTASTEQKVNNIKAMDNVSDYMLKYNQQTKSRHTSWSKRKLNLLRRHMKSLEYKHMPEKYVKFQKHRHKNWISYGILRSNQFRDNLYLKCKHCTGHSWCWVCWTTRGTFEWGYGNRKLQWLPNGIPWLNTIQWCQKWCTDADNPDWHLELQRS